MISYIFVAVAVLTLYLLSMYMCKRLDSMIAGKKDGTYIPSTKKSIIELIIFIIIFAGNASLAVLPAFALWKVVLLTAFVFIISVVVVNQIFYSLLGKFTPIVFTLIATGVMLLLHLDSLGVL